MSTSGRSLYIFIGIFHHFLNITGIIYHELLLVSQPCCMSEIRKLLDLKRSPASRSSYDKDETQSQKCNDDIGKN